MSVPEPLVVARLTDNEVHHEFLPISSFLPVQPHVARTETENPARDEDYNLPTRRDQSPTSPAVAYLLKRQFPQYEFARAEVLKYTTQTPEQWRARILETCGTRRCCQHPIQALRVLRLGADEPRNTWKTGTFWGRTLHLDYQEAMAEWTQRRWTRESDYLIQVRNLEREAEQQAAALLEITEEVENPEISDDPTVVPEGQQEDTLKEGESSLQQDTATEVENNSRVLFQYDNLCQVTGTGRQAFTAAATDEERVHVSRDDMELNERTAGDVAAAPDLKVPTGKVWTTHDTTKRQDPQATEDFHYDPETQTTGKMDVEKSFSASHRELPVVSAPPLPIVYDPITQTTGRLPTYRPFVEKKQLDLFHRPRNLKFNENSLFVCNGCDLPLYHWLDFDLYQSEKQGYCVFDPLSLYSKGKFFYHVGLKIQEAQDHGRCAATTSPPKLNYVVRLHCKRCESYLGWVQEKSDAEKKLELDDLKEIRHRTWHVLNALAIRHVRAAGSCGGINTKDYINAADQHMNSCGQQERSNISAGCTYNKAPSSSSEMAKTRTTEAARTRIGKTSSTQPQEEEDLQALYDAPGSIFRELLVTTGTISTESTSGGREMKTVGRKIGMNYVVGAGDTILQRAKLELDADCRVLRW
ncbi:unnamed protein product [Amoebophrya sp. A120]|nr:unnamed protein product [Amoebophrya sp. A120]|eukprot:GSA120T00009141001.1